MKKIFSYGGTFACFFFFFSIPWVQAQVPGGGNEPGNEVPIDGGASILAAAGLGYGLKKFRDHKRKNNNEEE